MSGNQGLKLVGVLLGVVGLLGFVAYYSLEPSRPPTAEEKQAADAAASAQAAESANVDAHLDSVITSMDALGFVMRQNVFDDHAEVYVDPQQWARTPFSGKQWKARALAKKCGRTVVYIFDGYSGKKLARQGPRGLDIE